MTLHRRSRVGIAATLLVFAVAMSAQANIVDDLNNMINTVNNLLGQAKSMAKTAAQNAYDNLDSSLRTASNSVTSAAATARQSASDNRNNINQLIDNSLVIYPGDVTAPLQGILNCMAGIQTALGETGKIIGVANTAKQIIPSELDAARVAAPRFSASATAALKATETAAAETDTLSQRLAAWSTALQRMSKESNDVALAIKEGRYRDLPQQQQELQQAQTAYQSAWNQLQTQATKTQAALSQARLAVGVATRDASVMTGHLQKALDQVGNVVSQVTTAMTAFNTGYNTCISAVNDYVNKWNQAVANARQRFLDSLTAAQRGAIANLNQSVTQADALAAGIGIAVTGALAAAQPVVNAAESSIASAVSGMISSFAKFLIGFLTHAWDLNMTQMQNDLNTLTNNIATAVANVANAVYTAANPKKTEAENQLATLSGIAQQLSQLYQQLYQVASGANVALRAGVALAQPKAFQLMTVKTIVISTASIQTSTSTQLKSTLNPYVQTLSKSVYNERVARKLPVL